MRYILSKTVAAKDIGLADDLDLRASMVSLPNGFYVVPDSSNGVVHTVNLNESSLISSVDRVKTDQFDGRFKTILGVARQGERLYVNRQSGGCLIVKLDGEYVRNHPSVIRGSSKRMSNIGVTPDGELYGISYHPPQIVNSNGSAKVVRNVCEEDLGIVPQGYSTGFATFGDSKAGVLVTYPGGCRGELLIYSIVKDEDNVDLSMLHRVAVSPNMKVLAGNGDSLFAAQRRRVDIYDADGSVKGTVENDGIVNAVGLAANDKEMVVASRRFSIDREGHMHKDLEFLLFK